MEYNITAEICCANGRLTKVHVALHKELRKGFKHGLDEHPRGRVRGHEHDVVCVHAPLEEVVEPRNGEEEHEDVEERDEDEEESESLESSEELSSSSEGGGVGDGVRFFFFFFLS